MAENLFSEFHSSHRSDWDKQVAQEIKQPLSELRNCNPLYPHACPPYFSYEEYDPAYFTELQNSQRKDTGWLNMPAILVKDPAGTTKKINEKLATGAQAILLKTESIPVEQITGILAHINTKGIPVFISSQDPELLFKAFQSGSLHLKGGIANDPLANWMRSGNAFSQNLSALIQICQLTGNTPDFYPIIIDGHVYHEAGVTPEQELAMVMAAFVFYLDKLTDSGLSALVISNNIFFSLSIGTDYLSEIAKLRALRLLRNRILQAYGCKNSEITDAFIHTETSGLYQAATMEHTNIIRATTEAMSAVIGGCNALTIRAFDHGNDFSERIAMNISSIIAHESGMTQVADPSSGSYFLDNRSQMMAEMAWNLFLEIENQGGIMDSFSNGFIQNLAKVSWDAKVKALREGYVMVGVNKYNTSAKNNLAIATDEKVADGLLTSQNLPSSWYTN